jgi:hypothetical protein
MPEPLRAVPPFRSFPCRDRRMPDDHGVPGQPGSGAADGGARPVEGAIDEAGAAALTDLNTALANAGTDWAYYADGLARRIHRPRRSPARGGSALVGRTPRHDRPDPVVMLANHLSYSDANLVEILLFRLAVRRSPIG